MTNDNIHGLRNSSRSTETREYFRIFIYMKKELSIYVDETGDFGPYDSNAKIYGVAFVLCEDLDKCDPYLRRFHRRLKGKEAGDFPIHVGPLIRREDPYSELNYESRLVLFDIILTYLSIHLLAY